MRFLITQNKKIVMIAVTILIVTASLAMLFLNGGLGNIQTNALGATIHEAATEGIEVDLEDVRSLNELMDLR